MYVENIHLFNFRNFVEISVNLSPETNFIIGDNGQGKTNFIESINFLATAKSFRTGVSNELVNWSSEDSSVFAQVIQNISNIELGIIIKNNRKEVFINQNKVKSLVDFLGKLICVTFSPMDLYLVKGDSVKRRSFIDKHSTDLNPNFVNKLSKYNRTLSNKKKLLKQKVRDRAIYESLNAILSESSKAILLERIKLIRELSVKAGSIYNEFTGNKDGKLELEIKSFIQERQTQSEIFEIYEKNLEKEILLSSVLVGSHRDDVVINLNGKSAKQFVSQGQARSIVLALKLAIIEIIEEKYKDSLVLLLDDVDSELDKARRESLFEYIFSKKRQVVITGTEFINRGLISSPNVLTIKNGGLLT